MINNEQILEKSLNQIPLNSRSDIPSGYMNEYLASIVESFWSERIRQFPAICKEAREINVQQLKFYEEHGNRSPIKVGAAGSFGGTTGWSKDMSLKFKWTIPNSLRYFMRNVVYIHFWDDKNAKVRDKFMKGLLRGDDPWELLTWIRKQYGTDINAVVQRETQKEYDLQEQVRDRNMRESARTLPKPEGS